MPNDIPTRQNESRFLDLLCASSGAYHYVKTIDFTETALAISAAVFGPIIAAFWPDASIIPALYAVAILVIDVVFLEPAVRRYQDLGAKIQELFDTELLAIPWNLYRVGEKPTPEKIHELATKFRVKASDKKLRQKRDWYPTAVDQLPIEQGRFICQRSNMQWDASLRQYYFFLFSVVLVVLLIGAFIFGVLRALTLSNFVLAVIVPLLPAGVRIWREAKRHADSAAASERARRILEENWTKAIDGTLNSQQSLDVSRRLQDELYDRRKSSPAVPEWLYAYQRESYEDQMKYSANQMVSDALARLA